jgi:hypothetical protein
MVAQGVASYGWLSAEMFYIVSPVLGAIVGFLCGIVGWGITEMVRALR